MFFTMNVSSTQVMLTGVATSILRCTVTNRIFVSHFGVKTNVAAVLYLHLCKSNIKPEWLLMGLNFLSKYDSVLSTNSLEGMISRQV